MNHKKNQIKTWWFLIFVSGCFNTVMFGADLTPPLQESSEEFSKASAAAPGVEPSPDVTLDEDTTKAEQPSEPVPYSTVVPTEQPPSAAAPTPLLLPEPTPTPTIAPIPALLPIPKPITEPEQPTIVPPEQLPTETIKVGIDTLDIEDGGNWLLKRKALEDTVSIIEESNALFTKVLQASTDFKVNRNKLDSEYDLFVATIGFNLGDLDQLLTMFLEDLEKERKEEGDLSVDERAAIKTINEKKNEVEQLQANLKALSALNDELDTVITTVDAQIKAANNYQNQAWKNFQMIKKVLSDEKADELYYQTENLYKSMQDIYAYLTQTLSAYFSGQMQAMRDQMNVVKSTVQTLQQKGIDLKKNIDQLEEKDKQEEHERLEKEEQEAIQKAIAQYEKAKKKPSWLQSVKSVLLYPLNLVTLAWSWVITWIRSLMGQKPKADSAQAKVATEMLITPEETGTRHEVIPLIF